MTEQRRHDRAEPVGAPVVRGDADVTGDHASDAVAFDPDDPESVARATATVRAFASDDDEADPRYVLRGAAACAALVRGTGSYKAAVDRAGEPVTVSFVRKWARVHDLPLAIRRHVAMGDIAPTAAKHIARVRGAGRFDLAWAVLDNDLSVRAVRSVASDVNDGRPIEEALAEVGVTPGQIRLSLDLDTYRELRRVAAVEKKTPGDVVADALASYASERNR